MNGWKTQLTHSRDYVAQSIRVVTGLMDNDDAVQIADLNRGFDQLFSPAVSIRDLQVQTSRLKKIADAFDKNAQLALSADDAHLVVKNLTVGISSNAMQSAIAAKLGDWLQSRERSVIMTASDLKCDPDLTDVVSVIEDIAPTARRTEMLTRHLLTVGQHAQRHLN